MRLEFMQHVLKIIVEFLIKKCKNNKYDRG